MFISVFTTGFSGLFATICRLIISFGIWGLDGILLLFCFPLGIVGITGGGGGGGGGGGIAPPDFAGSAPKTTRALGSFGAFGTSSDSFSIGTLTSTSSFLEVLFANVLASSSFFFSFSLFLFFSLFFFTFSHFFLLFSSTLISAKYSSISESSSFSSSSFSLSLGSSSSIATLRPIALSALNSSVPIIKGNLIFAPLSIIIFELATETVSSSISSLFLFFLFISFKQFNEISIAVLIDSTFVIWIPPGVGVDVSEKLFSFETDSDSLSSPLSKAFSINLSLDIVFIWFIAFKCSTSTICILLEKLSIFRQNCWNSSL